MRTHSPENPEPTWSREPTGGASSPALATQIISLSLPSDRAIAAPVARVMVSARSAIDCSVVSRSNRFGSTSLSLSANLSLAAPALASPGVHCIGAGYRLSASAASPSLPKLPRVPESKLFLRHSMRWRQLLGSTVPPILIGGNRVGMIESGQDIHKKPFLKLVQRLARQSGQNEFPPVPKIPTRRPVRWCESTYWFPKGRGTGSDYVRPATETKSGWTCRLR